MDIEKVIENIGNYTVEEFFKEWEGQQDVFIIKYDGVRDSNKFTILLLGHNSRFETINIECNEVLCGIEDALIRYKEILQSIDS